MDGLRTNYFDGIAYALMIIGALNWGLVGCCNFNVVDFMFGVGYPMLARIVYMAIGLSGLYFLIKIAMRATK